MTEERFNKVMKDNPNSTLVLTLPKYVRYLGFTFDFPLFCFPLGDGSFKIETDLILSNYGVKSIFRTRFPKVYLDFRNGSINLDIVGDPYWQIVEEVEKGRTEEDYNADRKKLKTKDSL